MDRLRIVVSRLRPESHLHRAPRIKPPTSTDSAAAASRAEARRRRIVLVAVSLLLTLSGLTRWVSQARAGSPEHTASAATILVYHRFGPVLADSMTITTATFAEQLDYLRNHGYAIVPLRKVVDFAAGRGTLPARAVAITADDGHRTVFTEMKPLIERYRVPVTLFIYPSAISNASYAMTWDQLRALKATGLFDIQSHTYWHPNFNIERRRLSAADFDRFARTQLTKARDILDARLGLRVDMLAWPFGIYDDALIRIARDCGYVAGFTIERRPVTQSDNPMALPRYLVTSTMKRRDFEAILQAGASRHNPGE
jgi:peptidoglycan/xylan/chitin deacetylase (PgdA/CDA1 family)